MSSLSPRELWETTGRLDVVDVLMKTALQIKRQKRNQRTHYLDPTHEELIAPIALSLYARSYKDLPYYVVSDSNKVSK